MHIKYTLSDIDSTVKAFWKIAKPYKVITFKGGLGAGKTTFTRALCRYLGVEDTVNSPTFSLVNEYHFKDEDGKDNIIYHSDWYRINDEEEAVQAGIEDMLQQEGWCIIEWAERFPALLPKHHLSVEFQIDGEDDSRLLLLSN
jgi:tRNA threonylcarbamoyladenosine biosynthesis protein TsaE